MTKILGKSVATAKQMSSYLLSVNSNPKFSRNITALEFCQLFIDICAKEGVRGDIAFAQACKETGNFKFGGDVSYTQNNFAGLGATGGGVCGCIFPSIEVGILAQAQHLKTYATKESLNINCVDPRRTNWFVNAKGGTSPDIESLGGTWAVPGYDTKKYTSLAEANKAKDSYGYQIVNILNNILKIKEKEDDIMEKPIIALSAGHSKNTAGKRCMKALDTNETREWYLNNRIIDKVETKLKAYNCTVIRVNDTTGNIDTPLSTRVKTANDAKADVYVSMHHNAGLYGRNGGGTVILYYPSGTCKDDATKLYNEIIKQTNLKGNRSTPIANGSHLYEIKQTKMPCFLVENGFMDSPVDVPIILSEEHAEKTAIGVVNFLAEYLKLSKNNNVTISEIPSQIPVSPSTSTSTVFKKYIYNGIDYSLVFDPEYYANKYSDLKKAFGNDSDKLFKHFNTYGMKESRIAKATFNVIAYKNRYVDLQNAFGGDLPAYYRHYCQFGYKEGRSAV